MALKAVSVDVTVERLSPPTEGRPARAIRLAARLEPSSPGVLPTAEELHQVLEELTARLDSALALSGEAPPKTHGPERELEELIETYHPRQLELVDLLQAEGELSPREAGLLRARLGPATPAVPPSAERHEREPPERLPPPPRPVEELLSAYQIASLKQAGAVRARRQISFAEYMALKRHFNEAGETSAAGPG